jgi:hypothetical protein
MEVKHIASSRGEQPSKRKNALVTLDKAYAHGAAVERLSKQRLVRGSSSPIWGK